MENSSQDDRQVLITPFKALSSNALRRSGLEGLIKALTHQQIRKLRSAIEEVNLHCDVIAELPLEISQMILQYLPIHQIFQARRVSSKWRQILSSAQTVEPLLRGWFPKGDVGLGLRFPKGISSESIASLKAEHVDAYRTGHAFTYASYEWDCFIYDFAPGYVAYAEGFMAWVAGEQSDLVKILDLKTGQQESFLLEDEAKIKDIAISSSIVVALISEGCHVWSLTTGESHFLQYQTSFCRQRFVSVSGESLAFAYPIDPGGECGFEVSTWTLKDQRLSSFFVATPTNTTAESIMLDSNGETLLSFYFSLPWSGAPMRFYYIRTNLDGDVLAQGVIETPSLESYHDCSQYAVPKEANGRAVIWSFTSPRGVRNFSELMLICYNFQENRLEIRAHMVDGLGMNINTASHLFYWKDAAYYLDYEHECFNFRVVDLQDLTCREAKMDLPISTGDARTSTYTQSYEPLLFGDETFFITTFFLGFSVWCFDKNVQMVNEDIDYKETRQKNIKERLNLKRDR